MTTVAKRVKPKTYFLTFGGTTARKHAATLSQARKDARYWVDFGQKKVCIHKRTPHGSKQVQCVTRKSKALSGCGCEG